MQSHSEGYVWAPAVWSSAHRALQIPGSEAGTVHRSLSG